ncbi:MAG TPA: NfeD family protein [Acidimicrobiia bacterium]
MPRRSRRSNARRLGALTCLTMTAVLMSLDVPGALAGEGGSERPGIDVVQVEGLLDPPNASLVRSSIREADDQGSTMVVLQIDSGGAVDVDVDELVRVIRSSDVPVVAWVGPSGSDAKGATALLVEAAHVASVSSGSGIGPAAPLRLDHPNDPTATAVANELAALAAVSGRDPAGAREVARDRLSGDAATRAGAVNVVEPTLGELIVSLDGRVVVTAAGPEVLRTATVVGEGRDRRRQPNQDIRFDRLPLDGQVLHTLISPSIAYLLFVAGLALIVFEFYTAAIGLAGLTGAVCLVGACIGLSHLPVTWWALGLLMLAILGYAIDVQAGRTAAWTGIGTAALVAGSLTLYGGSSRLNPPWWVLVLVIVGTVLFMLGAMPTVIRSRFSTPTVGREGMIGEMGAAEVDVAPDGVVVIRGARWRARTNRATPVTAGDAVRVVAVDGLVLEVEPESGGARDYRDGRGRRRKEEPAGNGPAENDRSENDRA